MLRRSEHAGGGCPVPLCVPPDAVAVRAWTVARCGSTTEPAVGPHLHGCGRAAVAACGMSFGRQRCRRRGRVAPVDVQPGRTRPLAPFGLCERALGCRCPAGVAAQTHGVLGARCGWQELRSVRCDESGRPGWCWQGSSKHDGMWGFAGYPRGEVARRTVRAGLHGPSAASLWCAVGGGLRRPGRRGGRGRA